MNTQAKDVNEAIFGLIDGAKHYLPDRFLNRDIVEKLWSRLLPKHKAKDYAYSIAKDVMNCNAKDAKRVDPAMALIYTLGCVETREHFYPKFHASNSICDDLLLEQNLERWLKLLPDERKLSETDIPKELNEQIPSLYRSSTHIMFHLAQENFYKGISYELRDVVDICLNLMIVRIDSDQFIVDFLDHYPWVKERQSKLYESAKVKLDEFKDLGSVDQVEIQMEKGMDVWRSSFRSILSFIDGREYLRLREVLFTTDLINNFMQDKYYSPAKFIQYNYIREVESLKEYADNIFDVCQDDEVLRSVAAANNLSSILEDNPPALPDFLMDEHNYSVLKDFEADMKSEASFSSDSFHEFFELLDEREDLTRAISSIVQGGDVNQLAKLGDYGIQLKALIEKISASASDVFTALSNTYRVYRDLPAKIKPLSADSIPAETPVAQEVVNLQQLTPEQSEELEALRQAVHTAELALHTSQEREAEMTELNNHLVDEIAQLKRALHAARSIPVVEKGGEDFNTELSAEWLRGLLREDARSTPEQILIAYATLAPDRVEILPSAFKAAKEAANFELPARLAQVLDSLIYQYLDLIRKGVADTQAKEVLGNRYAANESQTVTNNSRLRAQREFTYNGETIFFRQHIGIGSGYGTQHAIRIHFKVINDKIVIAYCGAHLETMRTN